MERIWKEVAVASSEEQSRHLPGGRDENHKYPLSGRSEPGSTFEIGTLIIRMALNHSAKMFGGPITRNCSLTADIIGVEWSGTLLPTSKVSRIRLRVRDQLT
jgi:hypothetical protein